jgi:hypothetical protein
MAVIVLLDLSLPLVEEREDMSLVVMDHLEDLAEELEIQEEDRADLETRVVIVHLKVQVDHQVDRAAVLMVQDQALHKVIV